VAEPEQNDAQPSGIVPFPGSVTRDEYSFAPVPRTRRARTIFEMSAEQIIREREKGRLAEVGESVVRHLAEHGAHETIAMNGAFREMWEAAPDAWVREVSAPALAALLDDATKGIRGIQRIATQDIGNIVAEPLDPPEEPTVIEVQPRQKGFFQRLFGG
jgi:hypothetical protein